MLSQLRLGDRWFKSIPGFGWAMAELLAKGRTRAAAEDFSMYGFREGKFIDENVAAGVAH